VEVANRQDWNAMMELYAEDAVYRSPRGAVSGKEAIRKAFQGLFEVLPDLDTEITNIFGDDDHVAMELIARGTTVKPWPAVPNSVAGKSLKNFGVHIFRFRRDKILTDTAYYDAAEMARQLGG
jgi:steroid delta-isomerase-like uncharacterized protein